MNRQERRRLARQQGWKGAKASRGPTLIQAHEAEKERQQLEERREALAQMAERTTDFMRAQQLGLWIPGMGEPQ